MQLCWNVHACTQMSQMFFFKNVHNKNLFPRQTSYDLVFFYFIPRTPNMFPLAQVSLEIASPQAEKNTSIVFHVLTLTCATSSQTNQSMRGVPRTASVLFRHHSFLLSWHLFFSSPLYSVARLQPPAISRTVSRGDNQARDLPSRSDLIHSLLDHHAWTVRITLSSAARFSTPISSTYLLTNRLEN